MASQIEEYNFSGLEGEEMWASEAIDNTSALIRTVRTVAQAMLASMVDKDLAQSVLHRLTIIKADGWPELDIPIWKEMGRSYRQSGDNPALATAFLDQLDAFAAKHLPSHSN